MTPFKFKMLRIERGWTQQQMADALGTTANTVARLERGELKLHSRWLVLIEMLQRL